MRNPFKKKPAITPVLSDEQQQVLAGLEERLAEIEKTASPAEKLTQLEAFQAAADDDIDTLHEAIEKKSYKKDSQFLSRSGGVSVVFLIAGGLLHLLPLAAVSIPILLGGAAIGRRKNQGVVTKLTQEVAPFEAGLEALKTRAGALADDLLKTDPALAIHSRSYSRMLETTPHLASHFAALAARPAPEAQTAESPSEAPKNPLPAG